MEEKELNKIYQLSQNDIELAIIIAKSQGVKVKELVTLLWDNHAIFINDSSMTAIHRYVLESFGIVHWCNSSILKWQMRDQFFDNFEQILNHLNKKYGLL
tara:strand:- start:452 stop:751 length:300 start_codon:yes stop_codon:yes gene_type:complete